MIGNGEVHPAIIPLAGHAYSSQNLKQMMVHNNICV